MPGPPAPQAGGFQMPGPPAPQAGGFQMPGPPAPQAGGFQMPGPPTPQAGGFQMPGPPGGFAPASPAPASPGPVQVVPVQVVPVQVVPVQVTPARPQAPVPAAPSAQPPAGGGLDLALREEDEPPGAEDAQEADEEEDLEEEAPKRSSGSGRAARRGVSSGRQRALGSSSSGRARALRSSGRRAIVSADDDEDLSDDAEPGPRGSGGPDPRLLAGLAGVGVLLLVAAFALTRGGAEPEPRRVKARKSSQPDADESPEDDSATPRPTPTPELALTDEQAAFGAFQSAWGRDGHKDPARLAQTLSARGKARLLALAFARAAVANAATHAEACQRLGLEPSALPSEEAALLARLSGGEWAERYRAFAASAGVLRARGLAKDRDSEQVYLRLEEDSLRWEVPIQFVSEPEGWRVDFPADLWAPLQSLRRLEEARAALAKGDAAGAHELIRAAPRTHREAEKLRLAALVALCKAATERAAVAMREDPKAGVQVLRDFLGVYGEALAGTGLEKVLEGTIAEVEGPQARSEPEERTAAFAKRVAEGQARAAALLERIKSEKAARAQALTAESERAGAASAKAPLRLTLAPGFVLEGAVLVSRGEQGFKVRAADGEAGRSWDAVPPETALAVRMLGVREDDARDQLRLGFWALRRRMFPEATRAFTRAQRLDESLAAKIPDVAALEEAGRVFNGEFERKGTSINLDYPFRSEDEAKDWAYAPFRGTAARVAEGALEVSGKGIFLAGTQEIAFDGRCDLEANIESVSGDHGGCFGIGFDTDGDDGVWYLVAAYPVHGVLRLYQLQGGKLELLKDKQKAVRPSGSTPVRVVIDGTSLKVSSRGQTRIAVNIPRPSWNGTRVFVGGAGPMQQASIRLSKVRLKGRVRYPWLRKSFARLDALLFKALSRSGELPVFSAPSGAPSPTPLSAEDEFGLAKVDPKALAEYRSAVSLLGSEDPAALLKATHSVSRALALSPEFAAAYYVRAQILQRFGVAAHAERDLEIAIRLCPRFYEAEALRARALLDLGRQEEALAQAEAAIQSGPGQPEGYVARALVRFAADQLEAACADIELARALAPWDEALIGLSRNLENVLEGPPWARTFKETSAHYRVETNVSATAAREYVGLLEAGREHFLKKFPLPEGRELPPSKVLIFDTQEGYHGYAELSIDDRVESTLGCYLPRYRQLLLFEEKDDKERTETIQVLLHEGFHQFMHQLVPENSIPFWLNEGLAEFMSAVEIKGGKVGAGVVLQGRLENLRYFVKANRGRPYDFPQLMRETPEEFYSGTVWAKYAQAWAMVHFFELGADPDTKARYQRYVTLLREGTPSDEAYETAWKDADWRAIQKAWWTHVEAL